MTKWLLALAPALLSLIFFASSAGALPSSIPSPYTIVHNGSGWVVTLSSAPPNENTYFGVNFTATDNSCGGGDFVWLNTQQKTVYSIGCTSGAVDHYQFQYYDGTWHNLNALSLLVEGNYRTDGSLIVDTPPPTTTGAYWTDEKASQWFGIAVATVIGAWVIYQFRFTRHD